MRPSAALIAVLAVGSGAFWYGCSNAATPEGSALDFTPTNGAGTAGPQHGEEPLISNFLIGTYEPGTSTSVEDVQPKAVLGGAELQDSFVIEGVIDMPGWTTMPVPEKLDYLSDIEVDTLGACVTDDCMFTIVLAVMRTDGAESGGLDGFDVTYTVDGDRYQQSVDFVVLACPSDRPDCTADFDLP